MAFALICSLAGPALAAEDAKSDPKHVPGTSVDMPFLIAPIVQDGKLLGYAYVSSTVTASSRTAAVAIREKTPFLQDAFIRDVNAATISTAADPMKVDQPALVARLLADAKRIAGSANVVTLNITQIQVASARPKQS
ncbi:MAG TPA: hypothetical protein VGG10_08965 [Rhizomicrobium sp.]